jgi:hypothetical protein
MYVRDNNFQPNGCIAIKVDRSRNRVEFGLSVIHPKDSVDNKGRKIRFDRQKAQELSAVRLVEAPERAYVSSGATQHEITEAVMKAIVASDAPSRAVRFAKNWLHYVGIVRGVYSEERYLPMFNPDIRFSEKY